MNENKFTLEEQYKFYLKKVGLSEDMMHPTQNIETKRTFYAAWGQLLMLLQNDIVELPEEKSVEILDDMIDEIGQFFLNEVEKQN